jgi:hypothetical protein
MDFRLFCGFAAFGAFADFTAVIAPGFFGAVGLILPFNFGFTLTGAGFTGEIRLRATVFTGASSLT